MKIFDFLRRNKAKNNFQETMDKQINEVVTKKIYRKRKSSSKKIVKPEIKLLFSDMSKIEEYESLISEYYELGYKLVSGISMHGFALCATLIKEG